MKLPDIEQLGLLDMSMFKDIDFGHAYDYFFHNAGTEHYRLLAWLSTQINDAIIFDIGTYRCLSAFALSYNPSNRVISYDVEKALESNPKKANIQYRIGDVLKDKRLLKAELILVDTMHDGTFENEIFNHLIANNWKGALIFDDINFNNEMCEFWNSIKLEKSDITFAGHYTGTGLVIL